MKLILLPLLLILSLRSVTLAQVTLDPAILNNLDPATRKLVEQAFKNARKVNSEITVTDDYQAASMSSQVASEEYRVVRGQLLDAQTDTVRNRFMRWLSTCA